jgi:secondary thiamine-phosphate synthase enzyme
MRFLTARKSRLWMGTSASHSKASAKGLSVTVIISDGKLVPGTWQGIYFCEFDLPRTRGLYVKILGGKV